MKPSSGTLGAGKVSIMQVDSGGEGSERGERPGQPRVSGLRDWVPE